MERVDAVSVSNPDDLFESTQHAELMATKRNNDHLKRLGDEKKFGDLFTSIHGVREKLYAARWDQTIPFVDKKHVVGGLIRELKRLEAEFDAARTASLKDFEDSLILEGLGMNGALTVNSDTRPALEVQTYMEDLQSIAHAKEDRDTTELENLKMMRISSSERTQGKSPAEKWKLLYGMYGDMKNAEGSAKGPDNEEEVIKLRGAIYNLKQRPNLSQNDKVLLADLQARLKIAQSGGGGLRGSAKK